MGSFNAEEILEILGSVGNITQQITSAKNKSLEYVQKQNIMEKADTLKAIANKNERVARMQIQDVKDAYDTAISDSEKVRSEVYTLGVTSADLERITADSRTNDAKAINDSLGIELNEDLTYSHQVIDNFDENLKRKNLAVQKTKDMNKVIRNVANNVSDLHQFITPDPTTGVGEAAGFPGLIDREDLLAFTETPYGQSVFKDKPWLKRIFLSEDRNQFLPEYGTLELQSKGFQKTEHGKVIPIKDVVELNREDYEINDQLQQDGFGHFALTKDEKESGITSQDKLKAALLEKKESENQALLEAARLQDLALAEDAEEHRKSGMDLESEVIRLAINQAKKVDKLIPDFGTGNNLYMLNPLGDLQYEKNTLTADISHRADDAERLKSMDLNKIAENLDIILTAWSEEAGWGTGQTKFINEMRGLNTSFAKGKYSVDNTAGLDLLLGKKGEDGKGGIVYLTLDGTPAVNRTKLLNSFDTNIWYGNKKAEADMVSYLIENLILYKTIQGTSSVDQFKYGNITDQQRQNLITFDLSLEINPVNPATGARWTEEEIEIKRDEILGISETKDTSAIMQSLNMLA